jgi:hypothetical protein
VREEWNLRDYGDQMGFWSELPPPNVSLALIARAHGAKFGHGNGASQGEEVQPADPNALQALLGQADTIPYRAPRVGLPIGPAEAPAPS